MMDSTVEEPFAMKEFSMMDSNVEKPFTMKELDHRKLGIHQSTDKSHVEFDEYESDDSSEKLEAEPIDFEDFLDGKLDDLYFSEEDDTASESDDNAGNAASDDEIPDIGPLRSHDHYEFRPDPAASKNAVYWETIDDTDTTGLYCPDEEEEEEVEAEKKKTKERYGQSLRDSALKRTSTKKPQQQKRNAGTKKGEDPPVKNFTEIAAENIVVSDRKRKAAPTRFEIDDDDTDNGTDDEQDVATDEPTENDEVTAQEQQQQQDADMVYCICRKPDDGSRMIACDGKCQEWFHLSCVGLTNKEADELSVYFCPKCTELKAFQQNERQPLLQNQPVPNCESHWTRFAPPFEFNVDPLTVDLSNGVPACNWCHDPSHGVFGLPKMQLVMAKMPHGYGYLELYNEANELGIPCTRMCIDCTTLRTDIAGCQVHTMVRLPEDEIAANAAAAAEILKPVADPAVPVHERAFCNVCPQPASHECDKPQPYGANGCGLMLCEDCALWIDGHDGNLTQYIEYLTRTVAMHTGEEETFGVRPDAAFLTEKGELLLILNGGV